jgi:uncharacterized membrane protein YphA (DoxX/SURF4 family)
MGLAERIDRDALPYALGAIGLGAVTLYFGDFLLQWQPVPEGIPLRTPLALLSGLLLIAGGGAAILRDAGGARRLLAGFYALWVVLLHLPLVIDSPNVGTLLGFAEILSLALAGALLGRSRHYDWLMLRLYGLCPLVFGASHLVYADFTAAMVPAWIPPNGLFWAYATGVAHIAAGLAIASGVLRRLAAGLLALMCGLFVVLLHAPRVVAAPDSRIEWTMLFVSLSIAGAAWLVRRAAR